jgi:hypothetical protein
MRIVERRIPCEYGGHIVIYPLFDIHLGTKKCREDKLQKIVNEIKEDPAAYWIYGGDGAEFINRSDKRHKESDLADWLYGVDDLARAQVERLEYHLGPIASKCLAVLSGNHEQTILQNYERNVYAEIVTFIKEIKRTLDPIGIGFGGFVRLKLDRGTHTTTLTLFCQHGYGGGRKKGGHILMTDDAFSKYTCDCFLTGHRHQAHVHTHQLAEAKGLKIISQTKIGVMTGTFRDSTLTHDENDPGGYEDAAGYGATDLSGVKIIFEPDGNKLSAMIYQY